MDYQAVGPPELVERTLVDYGKWEVATYQATFMTDPRSVALARTAIGRFARICGFSELAVSDIRVAAGEALICAADRSRYQRGGGFSVHCTFEDDELRIDIQDSGGDQERPAESGYGTIIMRSLMNDVRYSRGGTRVSLVKRMDPQITV